MLIQKIDIWLHMVEIVAIIVTKQSRALSVKCRLNGELSNGRKVFLRFKARIPLLHIGVITPPLCSYVYDDCYKIEEVFMYKNNHQTSTLPTYQFIFSPSYWKSAAKQYTYLHIIVLIGVLIAVDIALSFLEVQIPVGDNLRIRFDFLARAVIGLVGGPFLALSSGMIADLLSFVMRPSGMFFPGYTLSAMLGTLIYALFFYRSKINIVRIVFAKLTVNLFINVLLGSVWSMVVGKYGYIFYVSKSIIKNSIMLPIECVMLYFLFTALIPVLAAMKLIPKPAKKYIPFI